MNPAGHRPPSSAPAGEAGAAPSYRIRSARGYDPSTVSDTQCFPRLLDGLDHRRVVTVRLAVDEERVLPVRPTARPLVDVAQVDLRVAEHAEHVHERAGLVRGDEHERGLVLPGHAGALLAADHQEARDVVGLVLDALEDAD